MDVDESSQNTDLHVTVMETATGKTLTGDEAPLASEVEAWLDCHPGWELVRSLKLFQVYSFFQLWYCNAVYI